MAKITKRTVDALRAESRERVVWDDDITGFAVCLCSHDRE